HRAGRQFRSPAMGYRESWVQRTGQRLVCRPYLQARPQRHRVFPADRLPRLQYLSCVLHAEPQTGDPAEQNPDLLAQVYGGGDLCRNQPCHLALNPPPERRAPPACRDFPSFTQELRWLECAPPQPNPLPPCFTLSKTPLRFSSNPPVIQISRICPLFPT